jgi:hypothetical protein
LGCDFAAWKIQNGKVYDTAAEEDKRHLIYCENCNTIRSNTASYTLNENYLADLTTAEIEGISPPTQLASASKIRIWTTSRRRLANAFRPRRT